MKIFVMQGTTNAGKTAHGRQLAKDLGLEYVSSGDIARGLMDEETKAEFAEGKLSPHDAEIRRRDLRPYRRVPRGRRARRVPAHGCARHRSDPVARGDVRLVGRAELP
jgi:cytidylate kinase